VFTEGEGKKGGNSVASMIWKELQIQGLLNGKCAHEINLVFDNCTGQNKNRMVMRLLFFLVKLKVCATARAIFLVKGHTKNDCDRMFNLMKGLYRKSNVYTPVELLALMNTHPQCTAIQMDPSDFKDWDALENTMVKKADGILSNHIFLVRARDSNRMMIQEFSGEPYIRQVLVREAYQECDWSQHFNLATAIPPGLPDIKWDTLYSKWGRFIPEDRKPGLIYYTKKPPESIKKKLAEQADEARMQRAKRTRAGADEATPKKATKKGANNKKKKAPSATVARGAKAKPTVEKRGAKAKPVKKKAAPANAAKTTKRKAAKK
jgi:hypothetical protein